MKEAKIYKALMVEKDIHHKVVVKAKQKKLTITEFISNLLKGNDK
jgi:hypothetical protein